MSLYRKKRAEPKHSAFKPLNHDRKWAIKWLQTSIPLVPPFCILFPIGNTWKYSVKLWMFHSVTLLEYWTVGICSHIFGKAMQAVPNGPQHRAERETVSSWDGVSMSHQFPAQFLPPLQENGGNTAPIQSDIINIWLDGRFHVSFRFIQSIELFCLRREKWVRNGLMNKWIDLSLHLYLLAYRNMVSADLCSFGLVCTITMYYKSLHKHVPS